MGEGESDCGDFIFLFLWLFWLGILSDFQKSNRKPGALVELSGGDLHAQEFGAIQNFLPVVRGLDVERLFLAQPVGNFEFGHLLHAKTLV